MTETSVCFCNYVVSCSYFYFRGELYKSFGTFVALCKCLGKYLQVVRCLETSKIQLPHTFISSNRYFFSFGNCSALDRLKLVGEFVQILCFAQSQMSENLRNEEGWKGLKQVTFSFSVLQPFECDASNSAKGSKTPKAAGKKCLKRKQGQVSR